MRIPSADAALLTAILLPGVVLASGTYDCSKIVLNGHQWHLQELGGPKSVLASEELASGFQNTTYTIDICRPLKKHPNDKITCPNNARACAVERFIPTAGGEDTLMDSWALAGDLRDQGGKDLDAKWENLSESSSHTDSEKVGLRLSMNGGFHKKGADKRPQKVIVEFICDENLVGNENLPIPEDGYESAKEKREEGETEKPKEDTKEPSLKFVKYDTAGTEADILRLEWRTKYSCLEVEKEDPPSNGHWGFFTWFIIIAFLSTATYLIFGSWLNYNRYGARGWDLLPHGDTIRDIPYLLKDWMRRVMNTVQGGGSRGGYAAV